MFYGSTLFPDMAAKENGINVTNSQNSSSSNHHNVVSYMYNNYYIFDIPKWQFLIMLYDHHETCIIYTM